MGDQVGERCTFRGLAPPESRDSDIARERPPDSLPTDVRLLIARRLATCSAAEGQ